MTRAANLAEAAGSGFAFRNRIINGDMRIDQRNAGASGTYSSGLVYCLDRYRLYATSASKFTFQQTPNATEAGYAIRLAAGFRNYLAVTSTGATAVGATDVYRLEQPIEGYNVADLGFGTANPSQFTISFLVQSSLTGLFGASVWNADGTRSCPFSYTVNAANTWEYKTVTLTADTTGTWNSTNGQGLTVQWSLGAGSTYLGTAGTWGSTLYKSVTGATNLVSTSGATLYITGVQLEKGSVATPFEFRPYGAELALCQRYGNRYQGSGAGYGRVGIGTWASNGTLGYVQIPLPVTMRAVPSLSVTNAGSLLVEGISWYSCTALVIDSEASPKLAILRGNVSPSIGTATGWSTVLGQAVDIFLSAEL